MSARTRNNPFSSMELAAQVAHQAGLLPGPIARASEDDTDALAAIKSQIDETREWLDLLEAGLVLDAREAGVEWQQIAVATAARSKQAAHARYRDRIAKVQACRDRGAQRRAGQVPLDLEQPASAERTLDLPQT